MKNKYDKMKKKGCGCSSKKCGCGGKKGKKEKKVEKVMKEYKEGKLHSGSKKGPKVTNKKQALAIALSSARRLGRKKK